MPRLVVINHAVAIGENHFRWRRLAERHDVEVVLLTPRRWEAAWFGEATRFDIHPVEAGRFTLRPMRTTRRRQWRRYVFLRPDAALASLKPDLVYVLHEENCLVHQQVITARNVFSPRTRLAFFTMKAKPIVLRRPWQRWAWNRIRRHYGAAFCHYQGCAASLRDAGWNKTVVMQTQTGVDERAFHPDPPSRWKKRRALGFEDRFVLGFVGRLTRVKGIDTLIEACAQLEHRGEHRWSLLLVGDGTDRAWLESEVSRRGWRDRVTMTGHVSHAEVPDLMRAMDALFVGSKTTAKWVDTWPHVVPQAMASGVPVVGSDSGAIPDQLGDTGLIFREGDAAGASVKLKRLMDEPIFRDSLVERAHRRCLERYSGAALADGFALCMRRLVAGRADELPFDGMAPSDSARPAEASP